MSEQNTRDLATHLSNVLSGSEELIHKARILAVRSGNAAAVRVLTEDVVFKQLVDDVAAANAWLRSQATSLNLRPPPDSGTLQWELLFPDVAHAASIEVTA